MGALFWQLQVGFWIWIDKKKSHFSVHDITLHYTDQAYIVFDMTVPDIKFLNMARSHQICVTAAFHEAHTSHDVN